MEKYLETDLKINKENFFIKTKARFTIVGDEPLNDIPDYKSPLPKHKRDYLESEGIPFYDFSSAYWYAKEGVYRFSDHWGRVNECRWTVIHNTDHKYNFRGNTFLGFCKWENFIRI